MHLLFATNNAYVPHVATTLASIFENNKDMHFGVHILATDISNTNYKKLKEFVNQYNHELDVQVINPTELKIESFRLLANGVVFPSSKTNMQLTYIPTYTTFSM